MSLVKNVITVLFTVLILGSCGSDSKEKIAEESFIVMEEVSKLLEGVNDKATAEAAKPKLEELVGKMNSLKDRASALNLSDDEMKAELEKDKEKMENLMKKLMGSMMKISMNQEVAAVLGNTMSKVKK